MSAPMRNPMDSMTSTWRSWDRSRWNAGHWLIEILDVHPLSPDKEVPVHQKTDKVPHVPELQFHIWILAHAAIPLILHELYINYIGRPSGVLVFLFYSLALKFTAVHEIHIFRRIGEKIGYFDGDKHPRDGVPDVGVRKTAQSLVSVITFRPMYSIIVAYRASEAPSSIRWGWLIFESGMYPLMIDFWYYIFHRCAHESEYLWRFHRTHHLTKHPNPLLTAYADMVQEFFDIIATPLLAYGSMKLMGFPMGFYEWWICQAYVVFTEVMGHSGLRMMGPAISPWGWLLKLCDMQLVIEDHDLHHRKGWKNSHNYGKQTRVWDRLFNTSIPRIEGHKDNIDYVNVTEIPLF
ncbi:hypothetical protein N7456_013425 [Penicillium angulare]|uniref:Fatty acid hydroxylase domain-containing protein n=1 Tax=Penicillium angulare TaxID=116970 RepID=A0A9W9EG95_9EURO|nr:hypothetical protein N7456_013425 [Penicillium angulare]